MTTRAAIVAEAREWTGTKYGHQASVKGVAADCIGFIVGVGVLLGLPEMIAASRDPACKGYGRLPDAAQLMAGVRKYLDPIPVAQAGLGDLLLMTWATSPQHFGVISALSPMRVIHAYAAARKVAENGIDGERQIGVTWKSLIVSAWRYRGVED